MKNFKKFLLRANVVATALSFITPGAFGAKPNIERPHAFFSISGVDSNKALLNRKMLDDLENKDQNGSINSGDSVSYERQKSNNIFDLLKEFGKLGFRVDCPSTTPEESKDQNEFIKLVSEKITKNTSLDNFEIKGNPDKDPIFRACMYWIDLCRSQYIFLDGEENTRDKEVKNIWHKKVHEWAKVGADPEYYKQQLDCDEKDLRYLRCYNGIKGEKNSNDFTKSFRYLGKMLAQSLKTVEFLRRKFGESIFSEEDWYVNKQVMNIIEESLGNKFEEQKDAIKEEELFIRDFFLNMILYGEYKDPLMSKEDYKTLTGGSMEGVDDINVSKKIAYEKSICDKAMMFINVAGIPQLIREIRTKFLVKDDKKDIMNSNKSLSPQDFIYKELINAKSSEGAYGLANDALLKAFKEDFEGIESLKKDKPINDKLNLGLDAKEENYEDKAVELFKTLQNGLYFGQKPTNEGLQVNRYRKCDMFLQVTDKDSEKDIDFQTFAFAKGEEILKDDLILRIYAADYIDKANIEIYYHDGEELKKICVVNCKKLFPKNELDIVRFVAKTEFILKYLEKGESNKSNVAKYIEASKAIPERIKTESKELLEKYEKIIKKYKQNDVKINQLMGKHGVKKTHYTLDKLFAWVLGQNENINLEEASKWFEGKGFFVAKKDFDEEKVSKHSYLANTTKKTKEVSKQIGFEIKVQKEEKQPLSIEKNNTLKYESPKKVTQDIDIQATELNEINDIDQVPELNTENIKNRKLEKFCEDFIFTNKFSFKNEKKSDDETAEFEGFVYLTEEFLKTKKKLGENYSKYKKLHKSEVKFIESLLENTKTTNIQYINKILEEFGLKMFVIGGKQHQVFSDITIFKKMDCKENMEDIVKNKDVKAIVFTKKNVKENDIQLDEYTTKLSLSNEKLYPYDFDINSNLETYGLKLKKYALKNQPFGKFAMSIQDVIKNSTNSTIKASAATKTNGKLDGKNIAKEIQIKALVVEDYRTHRKYYEDLIRSHEQQDLPETKALNYLSYIIFGDENDIRISDFVSKNDLIVLNETEEESGKFELIRYSEKETFRNILETNKSIHRIVLLNNGDFSSIWMSLAEEINEPGRSMASSQSIIFKKFGDFIKK